MVAEKFQILGVKFTRKYICELKIVSVYFYSCPQAKLSPRFLLPLRARRNCHFPQNIYFFEIYFSPAERGKDYEAKGRIMKLKK